MEEAIAKIERITEKLGCLHSVGYVLEGVSDEGVIILINIDDEDSKEIEEENGEAEEEAEEALSR